MEPLVLKLLHEVEHERRMCVYHKKDFANFVLENFFKSRIKATQALIQTCTFIAYIAINTIIELNISYKVPLNYWALNKQIVIILSKT